MKKQTLKLFYLTLLVIFSTLVYAQGYEEHELPPVKILTVDNFADLTREAKDNAKVILLEMSASYCGYCKTLEEEIIKPMLRSGDYTHNVLIRKLEIDSYYPMQDLSGNQSSPSEIASKMGVFVTPTLLFLDGHGKEVSERIIGLNSLDYYGAYVDEALAQGHRSLKN